MAGGEVLLGRDVPLGRLRELLERATSDTRSVALVSGQAGIGKSALVRAAVGDVGVLGWGTCIESVAAPGYWPWSRACDAIADAIGPEAVASTAGEDAPLLALIGRSFGPAAPSEGSERDRFLLMDAVSRWLNFVGAEHGPVVVVLDDLQWADESSLALLEFVARDPAPAAVVVIGCYRHDELPSPTRERLSRLAMSGISIELGGLNRAAVEVLATRIAGSLDATQVDELFRRAGGHPVFTRELALLTGEGAEADLLPVAVRDAIEHRLSRLSPATQQVLEVAAIAGGTVPVDVVADAAGMTRTAVDENLAGARWAGITTVDPTYRIHFTHDLYRETVAAAIPADRRVVLHRALGVALEERASAGLPLQAADLAHHFTEAVGAGEASRAAQWSMAAARVDIESLAFAEAAQHLTRWREAVAISAVQVDPRQHAAVLLGEADALARAGMVEEARSLLRAAHGLTASTPLAAVRGEVALAFADLGARAGERRDEVLQGLEAALADIEGVDADLEARLSARLARELAHSVAADRPRAAPLSERAIALGRAAGAPDTLITCLLARHDVLWIPGSPDERVDLAREIAEVAARAGDEERFAQGNLLLANALLEAGSAAFEPALEESLLVFDRLGQPRHRYTAATRRAALLLLRGDLEAADAAIEEAAVLGSWIREPDAENVRMSQRLELVRARGTADDLLEFAEGAAAHWTGTPIHAHSIAAGFCARAGDLPGARRHAAIVADLGSWRGDRFYFWSVGVRELAMAAIALEDRATCEELLADLAPIAGTCGVNGAVAAFAGSHGHIAGLLAEHLGMPSAHSFLADAVAVYERLGALSYLADFETPSHEPIGATPRPFTELTRREEEVLVLIARGLSNDEIVAELVVSPATVRNHITHIFQKLHVSSRAQAIVLAREAGLA